jgi:eukaryotic-like serine/threonine-protein kinase
MAPEQARGGGAESVDGQADVFSLGSILCEMLTSQPAYTGQSRTEIEERAKSAALTDAQTRLNECPAARELVTLAHRCLAPDPDNRPRGAGAVAEAISAYLIGVQERLKQAELAAVESQMKAAEERKRRRLTVALAVAMLGVFVLAGCGVYAYQRETTRVEVALFKTGQSRDEARAGWAENLDVSRWTRAEDAASAMEGLLTSWLGSELRHRVQVLHGEVVKEAAAVRDASVLLSELATVRAAKMDPDFDADSMYGSVFEGHGLPVGAELSVYARALLVDGLRSRPDLISVTVASYIDDWAFVKAMKGETQAPSHRLVALARDIDREPWRNGLRDALWKPGLEDRKKLLEGLAFSTDMAAQPSVSVVLLASAFRITGEPQRAIDVLRSVRSLNPGDPWVHQELGVALRAVDPPRNQEAIRAFTAATTLHPEMGLSLAVAMHETGNLREAISVLEDVIRLRPEDVYYARLAATQAESGEDRAAAKSNNEALALAEKKLSRYPKNDAIRSLVHSLRGLVLKDSGDLRGAVAALKESIRLDNNRSSTHDNLGIVLVKSDDLKGAINEFREAIRQDTNNGAAYHNLGLSVRDSGDLHGAIQPLREAVKLRPYHAEHHYSLGTVMLRSDDSPGAIREFQEAIRLDPRIADYHVKLGRAYCKVGKHSDALVAYRNAIDIQPEDADAQACFGRELSTIGQYGESVEALQRAQKLGSKRPGWAHDTAAAEIKRNQLLVELGKKLPMVLAGREKPANINEWNDLVSIALTKESYVTATRLFKTAFTADPKLVRASKTVNRFIAILCAARSASGQNKNDPPPSEATRTEFRGLALSWLEAELADYTKVVNAGPPKARAEISGRLRGLLGSPDLKGIRDDVELAKLPEAERASWRKLWDAVDALLRRASELGLEQIPKVKLSAQPFTK